MLRRLSGEISGAFGDLGTFLPYVLAAVGMGVLAPTPVFLGFAASYLLVALLYRMPVAVQPMKALGGRPVGLRTAELVLSPRMLDARPDCRPVTAAAALVTLFWGALAGWSQGLPSNACEYGWYADGCRARLIGMDSLGWQ